MKLWLIAQDENTDYDTYDSAVVAAETAEDARQVHPSGGTFADQAGWGRFSSWVEDPDHVSAVLIGEAVEGTEAGTVILASFNAG